MTNNLDKTSAKILVLGDSGVGKSSLIHLICHSNVLSSAQWTIGCSIDVKLHGNSFLEFWDIGGSRGHEIARSFLYQDYHGIVLVFDATNKKSRMNLNEWLAEAGHKTNDKDLDVQVNINVPIITIGTKKDLAPPGTILEGLNDNFTNDKREHSSVINFDQDSRTTLRGTNNYHPYSSQSNPNYLSSSSPFASFNSFQATLTASSPLVESRLLIVNTQDNRSFSPGSKNAEILNSFFKSVIDGRNKRFYNKFAI